MICLDMPILFFPIYGSRNCSDVPVVELKILSPAKCSDVLHTYSHIHTFAVTK